MALNRAAQQGGLSMGELVSNARSKVLDLVTHEADPAADAKALRRLALWALRYSPIVAPWDEASGADGLFIDIAGCAHLFGGEAGLIADLARRLRAFGLVPRLAVADTAGAAWALAHHGNAGPAIVASGQEARALGPLPLAGLRLPDSTLSLLRRLGLRRISEVIDAPRAPLAARFEALLLRLDQALGRAPEPLTSVAPPPLYRAQATFAEPIMSQEHIVEAATRLLHVLVADLERDAVGARGVRLLLFRVDGRAQRVEIGLAAPSRDAQHLARLVALRLDRVAAALDAEFGFEAAAVHVLLAEPLADRQSRLAVDEAAVSPDALAQLIDRLRQRLGSDAVRQLHPHQSHIPERAVRVCAPSPRAAPTLPRAPLARGRPRDTCGSHGLRGWPEGGRERESAQRLLQWTAHAPSALRPLLLLPRPEAAEVMALIPEGPPRQFRWRGVRHQVSGAEGPERIAPEWWRQSASDAVERDYYLVEDSEGRRFWLYRAGRYGQDEATPQWFVHGVFG